METKRILVTGVTGNQGGALASELTDRGHEVRGLTRDPGKDAARSLTDAGVEVVEGDFNDPDSVRRAAEGMEAAFIVATPYEDGPAGEVELATNAIDAVTEAGVRHIVYSSVANADTGTGVPIFDSKMRIEDHLRQSDTPWTIVAPVWFRENFLTPVFRSALQQGKLPLALPSDTPLQHIELDEIARFTAVMLEGPDEFSARRFDIASDETTPAEIARQISAAAGTEVRHQEMSVDELRQENEVWADMFQWLGDEGYSADIDGLRRDFPDVGWRDLTGWCRDQDWSVLARPPAQT